MNKSGGDPAKRKKIVLYSAVIGVVLVIILIVIGLFCLTNKKENGGYYMEYDGKRYTLDETGAALSLTSGETYEFCVQSDTGAKVECSAKVTANPQQNFSFWINGEQHRFYDAEGSRNDYSQIFGIKTDAKKIYLTVPENFSLRQAIEERHGGKPTLEDGTKLDAGSYFRLVISLKEKEFSIYISIDIPISNIQIDPPWIMF